MDKNVAVILAAGSGSRFGLDIPKQFAKVAGKTILEHTVNTFQVHSKIDEICIVVKSGWEWKVEGIIASSGFEKVKKVLQGGKERKDSSFCAIKAYEKQNNINLIFHDAVRPFISEEIITNCIEALKLYDAVDVAVSAVDTIINVDNSIIDHIPNRNNMMQGQTPQCFKLSTIKEAYEYANKDVNFHPTDDCGVVKKYLPNQKIFVVKGSYENIKITHSQDIFLADKLFQIKKTSLGKVKSDAFYKKRLSKKVIVIFGGSYGIGKDIGDISEKYGACIYLFGRSTTNTDVSSLDDIKRDLNFVYKKEGKIDFVVNTASILVKEPLQHTSYDMILDITHINYIGAVYIAKESIPFLEKTSGQLLNFASSSYTRGRASYSLYSSTKAAIVNITQALGDELAQKNIRINCISPERTATPMRVEHFGDEDESTLLTSKEVAYVSINTLLSNVTGQIIDIKVDSKKVSKKI